MIISINEREVTIPQSWNEMTLEQQLRVYSLLNADISKLVPDTVINITTKRLLITKTLMGIDDKTFKTWKETLISKYGQEKGDLIFSNELNEVIEACTGWLFELAPSEEEGEPDKYTINFGLTKTPWPVLTWKKKKSGKEKAWYGPADALENITIYEMGMAFHAFEEYMETKAEEDADRLLAILYRPPKPKTKHNKRSGYQGDRRLPLLDHEAMISNRMDKMKDLPRQAKELLLFWFACCRINIIRSFPNIFKKKVGERVGNDYGWSGLLMGLAGELKNLDAVSQQSYGNALVYLSYLEDQRLQMEIEAKKRRRQNR